MITFRYKELYTGAIKKVVLTDDIGYITQRADGKIISTDKLSSKVHMVEGMCANGYWWRLRKGGRVVRDGAPQGILQKKPLLRRLKYLFS